MFTSDFNMFNPKGLTVTTDEAGKGIVARIIINSYIERQGLLRPGDLILEANGERVKNPEQVNPFILNYIIFPYPQISLLAHFKIIMNFMIFYVTPFL